MRLPTISQPAAAAITVCDDGWAGGGRMTKIYTWLLLFSSLLFLFFISLQLPFYFRFFLLIFFVFVIKNYVFKTCWFVYYYGILRRAVYVIEFFIGN